jgi:serine/threonine-protein kinase
MKAISKDPTQRFQSAEAFRDTLSKIAGSDTASNLGAGDVATAITAGVPAMADFNPKMDPGFRVPDPIATPARGSRDVWLLVGIIVMAALIIGGAVYRSRQTREAAVSAAQPVSAAVTATSDQGAPTPQPPATPALPDEAKPEAAQRQLAVAARKARPAGGGSDASSGPSAAEMQGQQEAFLEQKRQLDAMETETDHLEGRAATVESSLDTLEQQMHQSGLGLRGDMVAARSNMRNDIAKAKQAMDASDTERARRFLDQAQREVEKLEAFLGHR